MKRFFSIAFLAIILFGGAGTASATAGKCCATVTGNTASGGMMASSCCAESDIISGGSTCATGQTEVDCSSISTCPTTSDASTMCTAAASTPSSSSGSAPAFPIIVPKLSINIPTIDLGQFANVTQSNGYVYIPFISVYLVGAYKLGIGIASILAIIMIMAGGLVWIAAAGDAGKIGKAKSMITGAVIGLVLTLGSYVALQTVNPDLVNFTALKIQVVTPQILEDVSQDQASDMTDDSQLPTSVQKPTWTAQTFICPPDSSAQPPAGVVSPGALVSLDNCPSGVTSSGMMGTQALHDALCNAGNAASADGYNIYVASAYRSFASQASLWCGTGAAKYPDPTQRKTYYAVPGFSNHGQGQAVDVVLQNSSGKNLYSISSTAQCSVDPATVALIEKYMEGAGFVRYNNEIWHFEVGTDNSNRCTNCGMPPKCNT